MVITDLKDGEGVAHDIGDTTPGTAEFVALDVSDEAG